MAHQLGRFDYFVQSPLGPVVTGASVTVYREGATVQGNQSGTAPLAVNVRHAGKLANGDAVFVNATTGTTYSATRTSNTVITLAGFAGTLSLSNGDRLIPSTSQPTLFSDDQAVGLLSNPLTTDGTGRVQCWMEFGAYDFVVSGGGAITKQFTSQVVPTETPGQVRYAESYVGNDAGDMIAKAIADLPSTGGVVDARGLIGTQSIDTAPFPSGTTNVLLLLGAGTYSTSVQVTVPNKCRIVGVGRSATIIKSNAIAPATGLVRLGVGGGAVFGCRIENLTVDCNDVAASIGVYSSEANEQSGVQNCVVTGFRTNGIKYDTAACQNAFVDSSEVYCSSSGATSGIYLTGTAGIIHLRYITVSANAGGTMIHCIQNEDCIAAFGIHGESATNLIYFDTGSIGDARSIFGHATITSCVNISAGASNGILVGAVYTNGATNSVLDSRTGKTLTASNLSLYCLGDGAGSSVQVITMVGSANAGSWFINSAVGGTVFTFADLATTPSVGIGNAFRVTNSAPTNVTNFTNGVQSQLITLYFTNANTTIVHDVTKIKNRSGANVNPGANTSRSYRQDDNNIWWEVS